MGLQARWDLWFQVRCSFHSNWSQLSKGHELGEGGCEGYKYPIKALTFQGPNCMNPLHGYLYCHVPSLVSTVYCGYSLRNIICVGTQTWWWKQAPGWPILAILQASAFRWHGSDLGLSQACFYPSPWVLVYQVLAASRSLWRHLGYSCK